MTFFNLYQMHGKGGWSIQYRSIKLGLFKKYRIRKLIKSLDYGRYKITYVGSSAARFLVTYRPYTKILVEKVKANNLHNAKKRRKQGKEVASIELGYWKSNSRAYKRLETFFGVDIVDSELKERIEDLISDHQALPQAHFTNSVTSNTFYYLLRERLKSGCFGKTVLKWQRKIESDGYNVKDILQEVHSGELIWNRTNPLSRQDFMKAFTNQSKLKKESA